MVAPAPQVSSSLLFSQGLSRRRALLLATTLVLSVTLAVLSALCLHHLTHPDFSIGKLESVARALTPAGCLGVLIVGITGAGASLCFILYLRFSSNVPSRSTPAAPQQEKPPPLPIPIPILLSSFQPMSSCSGECPICQEALQSEGGAVVGHQGTTGDAAHAIHESCLRRWIQENPTCPVCRHEIHTIKKDVISRPRTEEPPMDDLTRAAIQEALTAPETPFPRRPLAQRQPPHPPWFEAMAEANIVLIHPLGGVIQLGPPIHWQDQQPPFEEPMPMGDPCIIL